MMLARVFIGVALLICIVAPARAGDLEDLETAFETALETLNSRDLDHFLESWHPEAVLVARNYVFPVDRAKVEKEMWSELFGDLLSATKSASYTAVDVEFRVIGNTGIAWGLTQFFIEPKSGSSRSQNSPPYRHIPQDGRPLENRRLARLRLSQEG